MEIRGEGTKAEGARRIPSGGDDDKSQRLHADGGGGSDDEGTRQPYNCTFCRRGFPTAQALGGHMNVHRKDRPGRTTPPPTARSGVGSYEPRTTALVDALTGYGRPADRATSGDSGSFLHAERAPQELRLFGHVDGAAAGRAKELGGARDQRPYCNARYGDGEQGEEGEGLDLELRLGAAGQ